MARLTLPDRARAASRADMLQLAAPEASADRRHSSRHESSDTVRSTSRVGKLSPTDRLNRVGLRATSPRLSILALFDTGDVRHASADEIYRELREQRSKMGLATVYRVLAHLTEVGILTRTIFEAGIAVYELCPEQAHDHLVCLACRRIEDFIDPVIDERRRVVARTHGYAAAFRQLVLYGYCPECRAAGSGNTKQ